MSSLIDQVKALKKSLDDARDDATRFGLVITDSGAVIDGPGTGTAEAVAAAGTGSQPVRLATPHCGPP